MIKTEQKNFTFALPAGMMEEIRSVTKSELNISINSFVRNALEFQLKEVKREQFRRNIAEASQDQLFLADVAQCQKDFRFLDKEEFDEW